MSLVSTVTDAVGRFLALEPMQEQTRQVADFPDFDQQMAAILVNRRRTLPPWRIQGVQQALGVPAINRCVTLISNTVGMLSMDAYRNGVLLEGDQRPRLVVRPNPLTRPQVFYRNSAYYMATRGEAWWIVVKRDGDGQPIALYPARPWEITVEPTTDPLRPDIFWNNTKQRNDDVVHIALMPDDNDMYRGIGPLQQCGAAVSVAVEAQEWAANFYADGGTPSILIKSAVDIDANEADVLREQFISRPHNVPRVIDPGIEDVRSLDVNQNAANMLEAREYQKGDAAEMFGVPSSLLDHQTPGSTLTYQNLEGEYTKLVRGCLLPNYLEPMEQAMTDLLTRSTVARFHVDGLLRADIKTRYDVYQIGIDAGVLTAELARQMEGIAPGDVESAPVPFAPPEAIPTNLPLHREAVEFRCSGTKTIVKSGVTRMVRCNTLLGMGTTYIGRCRKCKKTYEAVPA
jgi:HK97 family phage portal protein